MKIPSGKSNKSLLKPKTLQKGSNNSTVQVPTHQENESENKTLSQTDDLFTQPTSSEAPIATSTKNALDFNETLNSHIEGLKEKERKLKKKLEETKTRLHEKIQIEFSAKVPEEKLIYQVNNLRRKANNLSLEIRILRQKRNFSHLDLNKNQIDFELIRKSLNSQESVLTKQILQQQLIFQSKKNPMLVFKKKESTMDNSDFLNVLENLSESSPSLILHSLAYASQKDDHTQQMTLKLLKTLQDLD